MTTAPTLCLVGTGAIAHDHMVAFDQLGVDGRRWVVSRRPEAAEEFARRWHFDNWGIDPHDAVVDPAVTLVVVTSPNQVHAEQASLALRAGKDVLLEIPAGLTLDEVEGLALLAHQVGCRLFVCHTMRSFPGLREVKLRVEARELNITQVTGFFAIPRRDNQGYSGPRSWTDDLLWHHGCHMVDTTLWVSGSQATNRPRLLYGREHPDFGMMMDLNLSFELDDGVVASHSLSYNSDHLLLEFRFTGDQDVLIFRNGALLDEEGAEILPAVSIRDLRVQNTEILDALASGRPSTFDLTMGMATYRILHELSGTGAEAT